LRRSFFLNEPAVQIAFTTYCGTASATDRIAQAVLFFSPGSVENDHTLSARLHLHGGVALFGDADYYVHGRSRHPVVYVRWTGPNTARVATAAPWTKEGAEKFAGARGPAQQALDAARGRLTRARAAVDVLKTRLAESVGALAGEFFFVFLFFFADCYNVMPGPG
jgi:hypothetical protein